jgi:hypothetical protein
MVVPRPIINIPDICEHKQHTLVTKKHFCPKKFPLSSTESEGCAIWTQIIGKDKLYLISCIVQAATDNIFINIYKHDFSFHPFINGLSDHDGQIITFSNTDNFVPKHIFTITRKINSHTIRNFTFLLNYENWEDVFLEKDVNITF